MTAARHSDLGSARTTVPVLQEVVTPEALTNTHEDVSSRMGFEDVHFEVTETDAGAGVSHGHLFGEIVAGEVSLLLGRRYHLYLFLRDSWIVYGSLLVNDCEVVLSDL